MSEDQKDEQRIGLFFFLTYFLPGLACLLSGHAGGGFILLGLAGSIVLAGLGSGCGEEENRCKSWVDCHRQDQKKSD